jgi:hypothetical protein
MKLKKTLFFTIVVLLSSLLHLPADEIHLVNGSKYTVKSWEFKGDYLVMVMQDGSIKKVNREKVKKISIDALEKNPEVEKIDYHPEETSTRITYSETRDLALPETVLRHMNANNLAAALVAMAKTDVNYQESVDYYFLKGSLLLGAGQFAEAKDIVGSRISESAAFPGAKFTFAMSSYFLGHIEDALTTIEDISVSEVPKSAKARVIKAYRELKLLREFKPVSSMSFTVLLDKVISSDKRIESGLNQMEKSFTDLGKILKYLPPQPILIIVSDHERFQSGENLGYYDGKVVIPASVLGSSSAAEIITHELTHSFLLSKTRGNCPVWLHEGLAQTLSGKSIDDDPDPFIIFTNSHQQMNPYDDSLATLEYMINSYSMEQVNDLLDSLESGYYPNQAVEMIFERTYQQIIQDRNRWLKEKLLQ